MTFCIIIGPYVFEFLIVSVDRVTDIHVRLDLVNDNNEGSKMGAGGEPNGQLAYSIGYSIQHILAYTVD